MGKVHTQGNWFIKIFGNEHPPVHVHLIHPDGKAVIALDGSVKNRGVPAATIAEALEWVARNPDAIQAEWTLMNNPRKRST